MPKDDITAEEFLQGFVRHHGELAAPGLEYLAGLGPVERKTVNLLELSDALHYVEVARVVDDLSDDHQQAELYCALTERFGLPDADVLVELVTGD